MDANFIAGLLSGVAATLVGFLLTMIWEVWKTRRERRDRDRAIFRALCSEIDDHLSVADSNSLDLQVESAMVGAKQMLIKPLRLFNARIWNLIALSLPERLLSDSELLLRLRSVNAAVSLINEAIASRQRLKDSSQALSNFSEILGKMDADIANHIARLKVDAQAVSDLAKPHLSAI